MDSKEDSCSTTGANPCVELIMSSLRRKVYHSTAVLTLYTIQASALCFKLLMLLKENTRSRALYKRQTFISHHYRRWEGLFLLSAAATGRCPLPSESSKGTNSVSCLAKRRREKSPIATLHSLMRRSTSFIWRRTHGLVISPGAFSTADKN